MATAADIALAGDLATRCLRIASIVQRDERVREQARELAASFGNVRLVNIVMPDSVLWTALSAEMEQRLPRWAWRLLAHASLAVGGRVRREDLAYIFPTTTALALTSSSWRVETHSLASARALPYFRGDARLALEAISSASFMITTTFEKPADDAEPVQQCMSQHIFLTGTSTHVMPLPTCTHACGKCASAGDDDAGAGILLLCGGCERTYYCSKDCQRAHRAAHAAWCKAQRQV